MPVNNHLIQCATSSFVNLYNCLYLSTPTYTGWIQKLTCIFLRVKKMKNDKFRKRHYMALLKYMPYK